MKIAYFGYNAQSACLDYLTNSEHEVTHVFTGEMSPHSDQIIRISQNSKSQLAFSKPSQKQILQLHDAGVDLLLAAEYPYKIPIPEEFRYAVNIHPTLLPEGQGPTPLPTLLLHHPQCAGVTFHKMTSQFDDGDLLLQHKITLAKDESFDTLSTRIAIDTPKLLHILLNDIEEYYNNANPQHQATYWPKISKQQQTINWHNSTEQILAQIRAFGSLGVYSELNGQQCLVTTGEGAIHQHDSPPGTIISLDNIRIVIASSDGFIVIPRSNLLAVS